MKPRPLNEWHARVGDDWSSRLTIDLNSIADPRQQH
jgi:hypothetical protein